MVMKESRNSLEMPRELPPDPDNLNDDRAHWAGVCIDSMADLTGCEQGQEALGDLLTNMFHWCDRNGLAGEMPNLFARAHRMYTDETMPFEMDY
jgi:hypothetical protein